MNFKALSSLLFKKIFFEDYKFLAFCIAFLGFVILFFVFPQIDLFVSNKFYNTTNGLYLNDSPFVLNLNGILLLAPKVMTGGVFIILIIDMIKRHSIPFAKQKLISLPFIKTDQCIKNCSFPSGDASFGFSFFALGFAFRKQRKLWFANALFFGSTLGVLRIIRGKHFFSDVVFAGFIVYLVCYLLYRLMLHDKSDTNH